MEENIMAYWWLMTKDWSFYTELKVGDIEIFDLLSNPIYYDKLAIGDNLISFEANGKSSTVTAVCSIAKMDSGDVYIRKDKDIIPALTMEQLKINPVICADSFLDVHRNTVRSMSQSIYNEIIKIIAENAKYMG
jgi:hypothetical protein